MMSDFDWKLNVSEIELYYGKKVTKMLPIDTMGSYAVELSDNTWRVADYSNRLIDYIFDEFIPLKPSPRSSILAKVRMDKFWAYLTDSFIIEDIDLYDKLGDFSNGFAVCERDGFSYEINEMADICINYLEKPCLVERVGFGCLAIYILRNPGKLAWFIWDNKKEKLLCPTAFTEVHEFDSHGIMLVKGIDTKWRYLCDDGKFLCEGSFTEADPFDGNEYARVCDGNRWYLLKNNGTIKRGTEAILISPFDENGLALIRKSANCYNFLRRDGSLLSKSWFQFATDFKNGFAVVRIGDNWNYLNLKGKLLLLNNVDSIINPFAGADATIITYKDCFYVVTKAGYMRKCDILGVCQNFGELDPTLAVVKTKSSNVNLLKEDATYALPRNVVSVIPYSKGGVAAVKYKDEDAYRIVTLGDGKSIIRDKFTEAPVFFGHYVRVANNVLGDVFYNIIDLKTRKYLFSNWREL